MPSRLNQLTIDELKKTFGSVDTCLFVDFTGLGGRRAADHRHQLRTACGAEAGFTIVKTTLAKQVFKQMEQVELPEAELDSYFAGPTAVAYGSTDPVALAKTVSEWGRKEQKQLRIKGGILEGRPLAPETVAELAKIPPRPILLGHVAGAIASPLTGFLAVLQAPLRKLTGLLEALSKKNAESAAA
jgi:large subunit ribosomal protein L10